MPTSTALLVIDVQRGMFNKSTPVYRGEELLANLCLLIERAHAAGVPVIYVQHSTEKIFPYGTEEWRFHPRLEPLAPDLTIQKHEGSSFAHTNLQQELDSRGITHLVITGMVTHGCVKAACTEALKLGYRVTLVEDAHSSFSEKAAEYIQTWNAKLQQAGAELRPAAAVSF